MPQALLDDLGGRLEAAVFLPIDAPAGDEMADRAHAGVLRPPDWIAVPAEHHLAGLILDDVTDSRRDLRRDKAAADHVPERLHLAGTVGEDEPEPALGTGQPPLAQRAEHRRRQWYGAIAGLGLGCVDLVVPIGALLHMDFGLGEVHIRPS